MSKEIRIKHECDSCSGTGLYVGMAECNGAAVVCVACKGKGWQVSLFQEFTGRKKKQGVRRVFETNPGIVLGEGDGIKLSDFGGMPLADWIAGKPFATGMENRAYSCPKWWAQCTGGPMPEWDECYSSIGHSLSKCKHFGNKAACWKRWDQERANVEVMACRNRMEIDGMTTPIAAGPLDRRVGGCRPEETGVGDWCAPGPAGQQERKWILWFEDQDRSVSVFDNEKDGRDAFAQAESHGWNCHLLEHVPRQATPNASFSGGRRPSVASDS